MSSGSNSESDHTSAGSERKSTNVDTAYYVESEDDGTLAWKVDSEKTMRLGKKMVSSGQGWTYRQLLWKNGPVLSEGNHLWKLPRVDSKG